MNDTLNYFKRQVASIEKHIVAASSRGDTVACENLAKKLANYNMALIALERYYEQEDQK